MEREIRRVCPYCGKEIKSNEASTTCPQCGVVHHMQCWEKNSGCCTKGCAASGRYVKDISDIARMQHHKKSEVAQRPIVQPERPPRYKDTYKKRDIENERAVRPVPSIPQQPVEEQCDEYGFTPKGRMSEKMKSVVQDKLYYYDLKMSRLNLTGGKVSWNGSAFLFPVLWMAYRKMYLYALIAFGIAVLISMVGWIPGGMPIVIIQTILCIAFKICSGLLGNYLYKTHAEKVFQSGSAMNPDTQWEYYRRKGGTSRTAVVVASIIIEVATIVLLSISASIAINNIFNSFGKYNFLIDLLEELY